MDFDKLIKRLASRPLFQRLFFAFTLAVFMSCSMRVAQESPAPTTSGFGTTP